MFPPTPGDHCSDNIDCTSGCCLMTGRRHRRPTGVCQPLRQIGTGCDIYTRIAIISTYTCSWGYHSNALMISLLLVRTSVISLHCPFTIHLSSPLFSFLLHSFPRPSAWNLHLPMPLSTGEYCAPGNRLRDFYGSRVYTYSCPCGAALTCKPAWSSKLYGVSLGLARWRFFFF